MIQFELLDPRMTEDHLGYIPSFLSPDDPRPAREQIDTTYVSGWRPFRGFKFDLKDHSLKYPDDPMMLPLAQAKLRDELILFYPSSWVAIVQPDQSFEVARLD